MMVHSVPRSVVSRLLSVATVLTLVGFAASADLQPASALASPTVRADVVVGASYLEDENRNNNDENRNNKDDDRGTMTTSGTTTTRTRQKPQRKQREQWEQWRSRALLPDLLRSRLRQQCGVRHRAVGQLRVSWGPRCSAPQEISISQVPELKTTSYAAPVVEDSTTGIFVGDGIQFIKIREMWST